MNGPEILHLIRHDLQGAVVRQGKPPTSRPMDASDIGVASLEAVGLATAAVGGKRHRAALGGEWATASCLVAEMCRAPKCRAADDLLMGCESETVSEQTTH